MEPPGKITSLQRRKGDQMKYPCPKCGAETVKVSGGEQRHGWGRACLKCNVWVKPMLRKIFIPGECCGERQYSREE